MMKSTWRQRFIVTLIGMLALATAGAFGQVIDTRIAKIGSVNGFPTAEQQQL